MRLVKVIVRGASGLWTAAAGGWRDASGLGVVAELGLLWRRQGGVVGRAQVRAAGVGDAEVRRLVRSGRWTVLRRGVYIDSDRLAEVGPVAAHAAAARLALGGRGVASHRTAAALHGLALLGPPGPAHLTVVPGVLSPRTAPDLRLAAAGLPSHHVADVAGLPVTTPARTVVDLGRSLPFRAAVVVADSALRRGITERAELDLVLRDCWTWPGIRRAARVVGFAADGSDSALESLCRVVFRDGGLPAPRQQTVLVDPRDGWFARVDFCWEGFGTVVEADGRLKYDDPDALWREKLRQERIEDLGYTVLRVTWAQIVHRPAETVARVLRAFARGSRMPTARPA